MCDPCGFVIIILDEQKSYSDFLLINRSRSVCGGGATKVSAPSYSTYSRDECVKIMRILSESGFISAIVFSVKLCFAFSVANLRGCAVGRAL